MTLSVALSISIVVTLSMMMMMMMMVLVTATDTHVGRSHAGRRQHRTPPDITFTRDGQSRSGWYVFVMLLLLLY
jgi:hypothetical protein